jgi:hypothetical protein
MEEVNEDPDDLLNDSQETGKTNLNVVRVMAILFILVIYLVIFAKIIFLK